MTPRVVLIGGTSHAGKSTLGRALAERLGADYLPTDYLGRHPGRPWGKVPPHVAEHYATLTVDALIPDVLAHYGRLWPQIEAAALGATQPLVVEGSAVWPESVATLPPGRVDAVFLTASDATLEARIRAESGLGDGSDLLVEKFIARTIRFNADMAAAARRRGLRLIDVTDSPSVEALVEEVLCGSS